MRNVANICSVLLVVVTVLSQVLFVDGTELLYSVNFPPTLTSYQKTQILNNVITSAYRTWEEVKVRRLPPHPPPPHPPPSDITADTFELHNATMLSAPTQCHFFPTHSNITVSGLDEGVFVNATLFPSITGISQLFVNGLQAPPEVLVQNGDFIRIAVCAPNEWNVQKSFTLNYGNRTGTVVVNTFSPPPPTSLLSPPSPQPPDFTSDPFGLGTVNLTSVAPGDCFTLPSVNDTVMVRGLGEGLNTSAWLETQTDTTQSRKYYHKMSL